MSLLLRPSVILRQNGVDNPGKRVELRTHWRPAPPIPGRHRKRQHLRHRSRVDPITSRRFPPTYTLNLYRVTNLSIKLHALHPPAPAACRQRPSAAAVSLRRNRTARPLHEGFSLRRLHEGLRRGRMAGGEAWRAWQAHLAEAAPRGGGRHWREPRPRADRQRGGPRLPGRPFARADLGPPRLGDRGRGVRW